MWVTKSGEEVAEEVIRQRVRQLLDVTASIASIEWVACIL